MEMENIIKLIETVSKSELSSFVLEEGDFKLSLKSNKGVVVAQAPAVAQQVVATQPVEGATQVTETKEEELQGTIISSPLVGTFYAAKAEGAEHFVKVGDTVKKGQVIGIIEAMKLMNEVESEVDGVIEAILVENEQMVEYGQPLFSVK